MEERNRNAFFVLKTDQNWYLHTRLTSWYNWVPISGGRRMFNWQTDSRMQSQTIVSQMFQDTNVSPTL